MGEYHHTELVVSIVNSNSTPLMRSMQGNLIQWVGLFSITSQDVWKKIILNEV
jgi:hypothetical protein